MNGEDLNTDAVYNRTATQLIKAVNSGLGPSFDDNLSRKALKDAFTLNVEQFSYAKTLTQFHLFKDAVFNLKGQQRSFESIKKIVADTGEVFNKNYLSAEVKYVTQSSIMARKWHTMDAEYLQFSTVGDSAVRPEHRIFDKFTALKTDKIWLRLYTPLAWGCRCTIIPGIARNLSKEFDSDWANVMVNPLIKDTIFDNNAALSNVIFNKSHPYFKVKEKNAKPEAINTNIPKELERYEKELGVVVNKDIFKYLKKDTPLYTIEPEGQPKIQGAYYRPDVNFVKIPIDERRKNSKWYAQAVVHHEFGHAIDFQSGLRDSQKIKSLMNEALKMYTVAEMKEIYIKAQSKLFSGDNDTREKHGAILDTIASLRPTINMRQTHSDSYWKKSGYKEAEFIAHISENKFSGNDSFKELMPALYKKMVDFEFD